MAAMHNANRRPREGIEKVGDRAAHDTEGVPDPELGHHLRDGVRDSRFGWCGDDLRAR